MTRGIGIDIIEIPRIRKAYQRLGDKFAQRILHPQEMEIFKTIRSENSRIEYLAGRFAGKEAYMKARGLGMSLFFTSICILNEPSGQPCIQSTDSTEKILISISHCKDYAAGMVTIEEAAR